MKLAVFTPKHEEARYFTEQVLRHLPGCEAQLLGELGAAPLTYHASLSALDEVAVHHLVDDLSVRVERVLLGVIPGLTIVHDLFLSSHGPEPILNSGFEDTVALINGTRATFPERGTEYSREKHYAIRELSLSLLPTFTDPVMHAEFVKRDHSRIAVASAYVPWPAAVLVDGAVLAARRRTRRISKTTPFRIGFVGGTRLSARAHVLFRAVSLLPHPEHVTIHWMVTNAKQRDHLNEFLKEWPMVNVEVSLGKSPQRWSTLLPSLDAAVHMHFGMFERTGPYLPLSLGAGVPCLVSEECSSWLPAGAAVRIRPGATEVAELTNSLSSFLESGVPPSDVGIDFIRQCHAPEVVRGEFMTLLQNNEAALREKLRMVHELQQRARASLVREISPPECIAPIFAELGWSENFA